MRYVGREKTAAAFKFEENVSKGQRGFSFQLLGCFLDRNVSILFVSSLCLKRPESGYPSELHPAFVYLEPKRQV